MRLKTILPYLLLAIFLGGTLWAQEKTSDISKREALQKLVARADSGDAKALYDLARLHDFGYDSIGVDSIRSTALYLESAYRGYAPARNFIGFRYYKGEIVDKNIDSALYWIRLAAEDGDITAAANMAYLLTELPDIPQDSIEAEKWLKIAAEAGVNEAQIKYSEIKKNEWDSLPPDSALKIGLNYYLDKAPILGTTLLKIAAKEANAQAMALLGDAYSKGLGVPYDHHKSVDYFYRSALGGNPSAQFIIAELLEFFPDQKLTFSDSTNSQSSDEVYSAIYWYERAAESGVTDSEEAYRQLITLPEQKSLIP